MEIYTCATTSSRSGAFSLRPAPPSAGSTCANLPERRVGYPEGSSRAIRSRPMVTPTTAPSVALIPLLGIKAPRAEDEAGEHSASNHGQEQNRQRLLNRNSSQERCHRAHHIESSAPAEHQESAPDRIRTCDLGFVDRVGVRWGSSELRIRLYLGFEFVWARLDSVPSVALLLPLALLGNRRCRNVTSGERGSRPPDRLRGGAVSCAPQGPRRENSLRSPGSAPRFRRGRPRQAKTSETQIA